jgi:hypothetical protein
VFLNKLSARELLIIESESTSELPYTYNPNNFPSSSLLQTFTNNPFFFFVCQATINNIINHSKMPPKKGTPNNYNVRLAKACAARKSTQV